VKRGALTVVAAAAVVAAFWPAAAGAGGFKGIVVAKQHGMLLVASPSGGLRAVRAQAPLGARLAGTAVVGRASRARIRGVVVRRIGRLLILSSNRHLIAVPNRVGRALAVSAPTTPAAPGAVVSTDVSIQNGRLEEVGEDEVGQLASSSIAVQATVKAVAAGSVTVDVQGQSLTVPLPGGLTLPASLVGQTVTLDLSLAADDDQGGDRGDDDRGDDDHGGDHGDGGGDG
jgi:hypothetical protein